MIARPRDRVEIRDVAGVRSRAARGKARASATGSAEGESTLSHWRIGVALAPHRVHRYAALQIEHRHDTLAREDSTR